MVDADMASRGARMLSTGLHYFMAVARFGSMREAAAQLRIAQSAISRQIGKLEDELRVKLMERSVHGIRLTSAGEVLLHHAQEMLLQNRRLGADLDAVRGVRRGHVVVRTIESFASSLLPTVLAQFCAQYPAVTLDISVARSPGVVDAVSTGSSHIGVAFCPPADSNVIALASMAEPQHVLVAPLHPLATARQVTLRQLLDYPVVAPAMHGGSRSVFDAAWAADMLSVQPAVETNSMHVVASVLMAGRAVAITSARRAQAYVAAGQLVSLSTTSAALAQGRADLLVRRGDRLPPAAEALARAMARAFAQST